VSTKVQPGPITCRTAETASTRKVVAAQYSVLPSLVAATTCTPPAYLFPMRAEYAPFGLARKPDRAIDVRIRAERRAGELLLEMAERRERVKGGDPKSRPPQKKTPITARPGFSAFASAATDVTVPTWMK
jgi:hypothetical protein